MNTTEIMFNLWYVHGGDGVIYSLRVRAYVTTGTEEENLAFLRKLAPTDYLTIAQRTGTTPRAHNPPSPIAPSMRPRNPTSNAHQPSEVTPL